MTVVPLLARRPCREVFGLVVVATSRREVFSQPSAERDRRISAAVESRVRGPVPERGHVRHELPHGHPCVRVPRVAHGKVEVRLPVGVRIEQTLLPQLHHGGRRKGLGDGRHVLERIRRHRTTIFQVRPAVATLPDDAAPIDDGQSNARNVIALHLRAHECVDPARVERCRRRRPHPRSGAKYR